MNIENDNKENKNSNQIENIENIRITVCGNVDAGKTTIVGTLVNNVLDDGRGSARLTIMKLKHEIDTGRTSTVSHNYIKRKNKIVTLLDLCGHERYLHSTIYGF